MLEEGELGGPDQDDIVSSSGMSPGAGVLVPNASSPQQEIAPFRLFSKIVLQCPDVPFHKEIMQLHRLTLVSGTRI